MQLHHYYLGKIQPALTIPPFGSFFLQGLILVGEVVSIKDDGEILVFRRS